MYENAVPIPDEVIAGSWWRASRYEINDGYIRPAKDATWEDYDPLQLRLENPSTKSREGYLSLAHLVFEKLNLGSLPIVRPDPNTKYNAQWTFSVEQEEEICNWCSQYGLLGILPHETLGYELPPRWRQGIAYRDGPNAKERLLAVVEGSVRNPHLWEQYSYDFDLPSSVSRVAIEGDLVPEEYRPEQLSSQFAITKEIGEKPLIVMESLGSAFGRYFPDVEEDKEETYEYPRLGSEQFFKEYAEPLNDFASITAILISSIFGLIKFRRFDQNSKEHASQTHYKLMLDRLADPVRASILPTVSGRYQFRLISPTLLSSLAFTAMQDLSAKYPVRQCDTCERLFVSYRAKSTYCSARCRNTAQKRRQRAKKKNRRIKG